MNKYQEALDRLENITKVPSIFINEVVKELVETFQELIDIYPEYLELKERATPSKPNELDDMFAENLDALEKLGINK